MNPDDKQKIRVAFKRMERDEELVARLKAVGVNVLSYRTSKDLDDAAWNNARLQRRIVEDVA